MKELAQHAGIYDSKESRLLDEMPLNNNGKIDKQSEFVQMMHYLKVFLHDARTRINRSVLLNVFSKSTYYLSLLFSV